MILLNPINIANKDIISTLMEQPNCSKYLPFIYMIVAKMLIVGAHFSFKNLTLVFNTFETMSFMFFGIMLFRFIFYYCLKKDQNFYLQIKEPKLFILLSLRNILAAISMGLLLLSLKFMPIGVANSIFNMTPIFVHLLEALYQKKQLKYCHLILTVLSFSGIVLIIQPEFLFGGTSSFSITFNLILIPIISTIINSVSLLLISEIKKNGISQLQVLHSYIYMQGLFGVIVANFMEFKQPPVIEIWMIAHALSMIFFNALVQILIYKAVFLRDPSAVLPFQYSGVVFGLLVDYYYFGEKINLINITGVLLTSIGLISKLLMA